MGKLWQCGSGAVGTGSTGGMARPATEKRPWALVAAYNSTSSQTMMTARPSGPSRGPLSANSRIWPLGPESHPMRLCVPTQPHVPSSNPAASVHFLACRSAQQPLSTPLQVLPAAQQQGACRWPSSIWSPAAALHFAPGPSRGGQGSCCLLRWGWSMTCKACWRQKAGQVASASTRGVAAYGSRGKAAGAELAGSF